VSRSTVPAWPGADIAEAVTRGELSAWDLVSLGGMDLPGVAIVTAERRHRKSVRSAAGADGATVAQLGIDPAQVTISLRIWTADHWETWQRCAPVVAPRSGASSKPLLISHPALVPLAIRRVSVLSVDAPRSVGPGIYEIRISCVEFQPLKASPAAQEKSDRDLTGLDQSRTPAAVVGFTSGTGATVAVPVPPSASGADAP
jgi:hypothetical protein